jgi:hypothetical protein
MRRLRWPRFSLRDLALLALLVAGFCAVLGTSENLTRDEKLLSGGFGVPLLVWMLYAWKFVRLNFKRREPPEL